MNNFGPYYCTVCSVATTGPEPYRQHKESAKHLKKASLSGIHSTFAAPSIASPVCAAKLPSSSFVSTKLKSGLGDLELTVEEMQFCGLLPSEPLIKPVYNTPVKSDLKPGAVSPMHTSYFDGNVKVYHCLVCDAKMSGDIPFGQHMASVKHQKKVNSQRNDRLSLSLISVSNDSSSPAVGIRLPRTDYADPDLALRMGIMKGIIVVKPHEKIDDYLNDLGF